MSAQRVATYVIVVVLALALAFWFLLTSARISHEAAAQYLGAIATFSAVIVALFGPRLQAALFRPKLGLSLVSEEGEATPNNLFAPDGSRRTEDARIHHLRVENRGWPTALKTQVCVLQVETIGPDARYVPVWSGEMPLKWKYHEIRGLTQDIGLPVDCDLCITTKDKYVDLCLVLVPLSLKARYRVPEDLPISFRLSLQARCAEGASNVLRVRISWDGRWESGAKEMMRHLVVREDRAAS